MAPRSAEEIYLFSKISYYLGFISAFVDAEKDLPFHLVKRMYEDLGTARDSFLEQLYGEES